MQAGSMPAPGFNETQNTERSMSKYTTDITWTMGNGKTAAVTVELETEEYSHRSNDQIVTKPCCNLRTVATIQGMGEVGMAYRRTENHPQGVAAMCGKLGIMEANAIRIDAAIAAIKDSPEWAAKIAKEAKSEAEAASYYAGRAKVDAAMNTEPANL